MTDDELEIFGLINEERKNRGLNFLKLDERLTESARQRSQTTNGNSVNTGFAGIIRTFTGSTYSRLGEVIVAGYDNKRLYKSLAKYSGQAKYIFSPAYTHIGIGIINLFPSIKTCTVHLGKLV